MKHTTPRPPRVIAFSPASPCVGYAVFEGPGEIVDWGILRVPSKDTRKRLKRIRSLIDWFAPDTIVVENCAGQGSRRGLRVRRQIDAIARLGMGERIPVRSYSRQTIRQCFSRFQARGKDAIARVIAREFPEIESRLPKARRPWTPEDPRMTMFEASSLALTHFYIASAREP